MYCLLCDDKNIPHFEPEDEYITCEPGFQAAGYRRKQNTEEKDVPWNDNECENFPPDNSFTQPMLENDYSEEVNFEAGILGLNFDDSGLHGLTVIEPVRKICTAAKYHLYFEILLECQDLQLYLFNNHKIAECSDDFYKRSIESLNLCLLENRNKLPCLVNDTKHVRDYLFELSSVFTQNKLIKRNQCAEEKSCLYTSSRNLPRCSDLIFNQLKRSDKGFSPLSSTHKKGFEMVSGCLNQIWPKCSTSFTFLLTPLIYIPLGIDFEDILKERGNNACLSANIDSGKLACTEKNRKDGIETIKSCLTRVVSKLINLLVQVKVSSSSIHWTIDPLSICVTTHPILECVEKDLHSFKSFSFDLMKNIQAYIQEYLKIFQSAADIEIGKKCIKAFSDHKIDRCLSLMFGFMTSYHAGQAKDSDYPGQCVEDVFSVCGNIKTFHTLMKKSIYIPIDVESTTSNHVMPEICFPTKYNETKVKSCSLSQFEALLTESESCEEYSGLNNFGSNSAQSIFEYCTNCILKNVNKLCYYTFGVLKEIALSALTPVTKCLVKYDVEEKCISEILNDARVKCLLYLHSFSFHAKNGTLMQAAESSMDFNSCIERTIKHCPVDAYKDVTRLYKKLVSLDIQSKYEMDFTLTK